MSVYTKVMSKGVHNIVFSVFSDTFYVLTHITLRMIVPTTVHYLMSKPSNHTIVMYL